MRLWISRRKRFISLKNQLMADAGRIGRIGLILLALAAVSGVVLALEPPTREQLEQYRRDGTLAQRIAAARAIGLSTTV